MTKVAEEIDLAAIDRKLAEQADTVEEEERELKRNKVSVMEVLSRGLNSRRLVEPYKSPYKPVVVFPQIR